MTVDHVNKYLFNGTIPYLFEIGRLALPLFIFVLAYNLNRPGVLAKEKFTRIAIRLFVFGLIATVPFVLLGGVDKWFLPLNVLFTLLAISSIVFCFNYGGAVGITSAIVIFALGGAVVEFGWIAIYLGVMTWAALKFKSIAIALGAVVGCIALAKINLNYFAVLAL
ncbi:MAG: conjugal transfer protein TraX, partial [Alphaproteobacteria bacterium]|nr:conjugal transfer protein TraX [Alphaproteobacteria bacterium]